MTIRTSIPWIAMLLAAAAALNPVGYDIIRSAFTSGEQLARSLGQLVIYSALGIAAAVALAEFAIRKYLISRQGRKDRSAASGAKHG